MKINLTIILFAILLFVSCQEDLSTKMEMGPQKDEAILNATPAITLRSPKSAEGVVNVLVTEGAGFASERIFATASRPVDMTQTIVVKGDTTLVEAYRQKTGVDYLAMPDAFYAFDGSRTLGMNQGAQESSPTVLKIYATNPVGNQLAPGRYLLPVVANSSLGDVSTTLYYDIVVRKPFEGDAELYEGEDAFFVFYINTEIYDPRLVTDYYMRKETISREEVWYKTIGNIINLKSAMIGPDFVNNRALLIISSDLRYVLDHYPVYLLPLQEQGRKICISIEGANNGLGFCNLTEEQIDDFSRQVASIIEYYHLDGINLWDKNTGYGNSIFPDVNTTSYPKLIKTLRHYLGPDKLLTLTDFGESTEYFWDNESTGGILVGEFIDYAWSGYNNRSESYQIIDPYHQGEDMISSIHPRKPILGLPQSKYVCINCPWQGATPVAVINQATQNVLAWKEAGFKNNNICLFEDIRTVMQDALEGKWDLSTYTRLFADDRKSYRYSFDMGRLTLIDGQIGYNKWLKDW